MITGSRSGQRAIRFVGVFSLVLVLSCSGAALSGGGADAQTQPSPGADASFLWAEQFGTSTADNARSVAVDPSDGSPFVGGNTGGAIDPEGAPLGSTTNVQPNVNAGGVDAYVRKHGRDGSWEWTRQFGSPLADDVFDVAADRQGNVYVAGYGDPRNLGRTGAFIRKYDKDGNTSNNTSGATWTKQFNSGRIWTFALDPEGNPYIAVTINSDVYMYKYNPQGGFEAGEPFGAYGCYGALSDIAFGSAVGGKSDDPSVYITGLTSGAGIDNPNDCRISDGTNELFVAKFDGLLNKRWHKQFGSSSGSGNALGVTVDSEDRAYVTGYTNGTIGDPTIGFETNKGGQDLFVVKFEEYTDPNTLKPEGRIVWAEQFGTAGNDRARDVTVDPQDNIYVVGTTDGSFQGDTGADGTDGFVGKYDKNGNQLAIRQFGSVGYDAPQGVAYDPITKGVLVAGNTDGAIGDQQNKGGFDGFLVKMTAENLDGGPQAGTEPSNPLIFVPGIGGTRLNYAAGALEADNAPLDKEKWPRTPYYLTDVQGDAPLRDLKLAEDGIRPFGDPYDKNYETEVGDIIRTELGTDVYAGTFTRLEQAGYEEGVNFFPYPYDWRKDLEDIKGGKTLYQDLPGDVSLVQFIDYVREKNRRPDGSLPQVDILAHSRGGLLTYDALRQDASVDKVRKVVTLGTPFLGGSAKALGLLQYKAGCFPQGFPQEQDCYIDPATVQEVITNFPGVYELLPSRRFQEVEGSPLYTDIDEDGDGAPDGFREYGFWTGLDSYGQLYDNVSYERNAALMQSADEWHRQVDDLYLAPPKDPDVEALRIVGDSLATPAYVRKYVDYSDCSLFNPADCPTKYEYRMSNNDRIEGGDGTVALHSADLYEPSKGFDLRGEAPKGTVIPNLYAHNVDHGALARDAASLGAALAFFADGSQSPAQASAQEPAVLANSFGTREAYAETAQADAPSNFAEIAEQNGLDTAPESFAGIEVTVSGPATGFIEDGAGNHLGDTAETPGKAIVNGVAGGDYNRLGNNQSFFLNDASGPYKLKLSTVGEEDIELRIRTYEGGELVGQAAFVADPGPGAALELGFAAGSVPGSPKVLADADADGAVDRELVPASVVTGPAASETDPPTTTASTTVIIPEPPHGRGRGNGGSEGGRPRPTEARVILEAEDGPEGSGVARIYYSLPGDAEPRLYEGPFNVPLGTAVRFASVDGAGNFEPPKEVLVDDGPSSRETAEPISPDDHVRRYVDPEGDEDWYAFEADGRSVYWVHLHGLPADYDLELYDEVGRRVAAPAERGKRSEEVRERLAAGRYHVRVSGHGGAWDAELPYGLRLDVLGPGPRQEG